ncbi:MAG: FeoA family protein [Eggerthellaceae bacterium]|nr:FeoA family protein [Eggerthellaceae bacterium]
MAIETTNYASADSAVRMQQMPLSFLKSGERARVARVRGKGDVHHHLENLGFVEGADVRVVSEQSGNLIVEIKGAQVALDRSVASKIITC